MRSLSIAADTAIIFMFVAEMLNTAAEISIDFLNGDRYHPVVKIIKDITAGSVLVALIGLGICFTILFINHIPPAMKKIMHYIYYVVPLAGIGISFLVLLYAIFYSSKKHNPKAK